MANILLVDDRRCVRQLLSEFLIEQGHEVEALNDAEALKEHLKNALPDLIILDLCLNRAYRWDVFRDIKLQYPSLPVVVFTAYENFRNDPRLSQADGYVVKGLNFEELRAQIADVLLGKPTWQRTRVSASHFPGLAKSV
jgi:DNA-binding response OmpR family regulator